MGCGKSKPQSIGVATSAEAEPSSVQGGVEAAAGPGDEEVHTQEQNWVGSDANTNIPASAAGEGRAISTGGAEDYAKAGKVLGVELPPTNSSKALSVLEGVGAGSRSPVSYETDDTVGTKGTEGTGAANRNAKLGTRGLPSPAVSTRSLPIELPGDQPVYTHEQLLERIGAGVTE
jgi:hypothetical protein